MAERSKALRSGRSLVLQAWVRIPLLTLVGFFYRRDGWVAGRSPRMREIGLMSPVGRNIKGT